MTDAEKVFNQTVQERKRLGYGDKHKKRQGGRYVRLPSDYLSRKERDAMNGEIETYNLNAPVAWRTLRKWPEDIQRQYFQTIDEKYGPTAAMYAEMLGVAENTVYNHRYWLQLPLGQRGSLKPDKKAWSDFINPPKKTPEPEPEPEKTEKPNVLTIAEKCAEYERARNLQIDEKNLASFLLSLRGTGAKVTIEVTL